VRQEDAPRASEPEKAPEKNPFSCDDPTAQ
jgi:hypothetical protein